jgi:hypothetical protein
VTPGARTTAVERTTTPRKIGRKMTFTHDQNDQLLTLRCQRLAAGWLKGAALLPLGAALTLAPLAATAQSTAGAAPQTQASQPQPQAQAQPQAVQPGQVLRLPGGGRLWATEDPANLTPQLNVSASSIAGLRDDQLVDGLSFNYSTNYASFIDRLEVLIYNGRDADLVRPLVALSLPLTGEGLFDWDGTLPAGHGLRAGDTLVYQVRAYGKEGQIDETRVRGVRLYTEAEWLEAKEQLLSENNRLADGLTLDQRLAREAQQVNGLSKQNIPLSGSIVRIYGQDIPADAQIRINNRNALIDNNRRFVSEVLLPVGPNALTIDAVGLKGAPAFSRTLDVNVRGEYFFMVGMADFYLSKSKVTGNIEPASAEDGFDQELLK